MPCSTTLHGLHDSKRVHFAQHVFPGRWNLDEQCLPSCREAAASGGDQSALGLLGAESASMALDQELGSPWALLHNARHTMGYWLPRLEKTKFFQLL
jgi:hypothetical protein